MSRKIKMPAETSTYYPYNANPSGKRTGDCVIRAFSYALNITWDQVLDELVQMSHNLKYAPLSVENYDRVLVRHGWIKQKMPKKLDNRRYRGNEFCEYLNTKYTGNHPNIIAKIGSHHVTCFKYIDSTYKCCDIWDCTDNCIGTWWVDAKYSD